jgi:hypothetical protein
MQDLGGSTGIREAGVLRRELLLSLIRQRSIKCVQLVKDVLLYGIY